jgi:hypothetical protein
MKRCSGTSGTSPLASPFLILRKGLYGGNDPQILIVPAVPKKLVVALTPLETASFA